MMLATSWDVIRFNQRERVCEGERDMRPAFMNVPSSHLPWSLMTLKPMASEQKSMARLADMAYIML